MTTTSENIMKEAAMHIEEFPQGEVEKIGNHNKLCLTEIFFDFWYMKHCLKIKLRLIIQKNQHA